MGLFGKKNQNGKPSLDRANSSTFSVKSPASISTANGSISEPSDTVSIPKAPDPAVYPAEYLRSIHAVRERTRIVFEQAKRNQLKHFAVDMSKFSDTSSFVVSIIKVFRLSLTLDLVKSLAGLNHL